MKYILFCLLATFLLLTGCAQSPEENISPDTTSNIQETDSTQAPKEPYILTFEASTIDGEAVTSDIFAASKLTMLNIWGTYCNPCLSEMPDLGEIAAEYDPEIFQMYGIICDVTDTDDAEKIEEARQLIVETKADYPHLLLNQSLYTNLVGAVSGVPTTFFFNQDSELLGYLVGANSKETWLAIIEDLLSQME